MCSEGLGRCPVPFLQDQRHVKEPSLWAVLVHLVSLLGFRADVFGGLEEGEALLLGIVLLFLFLCNI